MSTAVKHLPILDFARAGAACWVMIAHLVLMGGGSVFLLTQGSLGVEVFIFISGFLMTMILKDETDVSARSVRKFYIRRFFRIAPSFYVALLLYIGLRPFFTSGLHLAEGLFRTPFHITGVDDPVTWRSILLNVLFAHGIVPGEAGRVFGPAWSLSLEMQFYLVAPFCVWFLRRWPIAAMASLFCVNAGANLLFGVYGRSGLLMNFGYPSFLPNRIFLFVVGGCYCLYVFEPRRKQLLLFAASVLALFPLVGLKSWLVCLLLVGFVHSVIAPTGRWRALWLTVAESPPTQLLAEWSYGIYLFHMFCMALVGHVIVRSGSTLPPRTLWLIFAVGVTAAAVAVSAIVHYTVERPLRDFGKRLSGTRRGRLPEAGALASPTVSS